METLSRKKQMNAAAGPMMIDYNTLTIGKDLGKGAFGSVTQATWKQPNGLHSAPCRQCCRNGVSLLCALVIV